MARQPRGRHRNIGELIHVRIGNDAAVGHEQHAVFADARVLNFHDHATRHGGDVRHGFHDLKQRTQHAAGDVRRAGNQAVRLVHRHHHRAEIIRLQHRLARFSGANSLVAAKRMESLDEIIQIFAFDGVDDADALD